MFAAAKHRISAVNRITDETGEEHMNKDWADKNKRMQSLIGKETSFREGLDALFDLRDDLFGQISSIVKTYPAEAFYQMPFAGAEGYHSKTLAYSMWHIFRIEDIVAHTLIAQDGQMLFRDGWLEKTKGRKQYQLGIS